MLQRLIRGDPRRLTRLHDFDGNRLAWSDLRDLTASVCTTLLWKAGVRWRSPWWPYPAIRSIGSLLRTSWRILEFGAGESTPWLARRVLHVVSMESNREWYFRVQSRLREAGCTNVDLRLRENEMDYATADQYSVTGFDLIVVDGAWRDLCARTATRLIRPGGYIYLDNSDVPDPDHRLAVGTLLDAAKTVERFVGLYPGAIAVSQGLLIRVHS